MNAWLERFADGVGADGGLRGAGTPPSCDADEARLVLELAGRAAHTSGARPYAPLAAYLAGQAVAGLGPDDRRAVLRRAVRAAKAAGPAGAEPIGGESPPSGGD